MQGNPQFHVPDRFGNSDVIPHFAKNGTALTQEERAAIAKRKGLCVQCGVKTHIISVFKKTKITNENVYDGICIKCNPTSVPSKVLQEYELRNPRHSAPVVPISRATKPMAAAQLAAKANRAKRAVAARHAAESRPSDAASQQRHGRPHSGSNTSQQHPDLAHANSGHSSASSNGKQSSALKQRASNDMKPHHQHSFNQTSSPTKSKSAMKIHGRPPPPPEMDPNHHRSHSDLGMRDADYGSSGGLMRRATFQNEDYTGNVSTPDEVDVNSLMQKLKEDRTDAEVLKQTLHRVRNFGYDQDPRGIMSEIRDLMDTYVNDSRVMAIACSALWRLAAGKNARKIEAAENGAVESIVDALRRGENLEDAEFVQWAVGCLASLADAKGVKTLIAKIGGIEVIVDVLNRHQDSAGVFEWAARALYNLVHYRAEGSSSTELLAKNISSIEEVNGIAALVKAMKQHPNEATAQRWAMRLLWSMQDQEDDDTAARVLKKMKDDGFVIAAVKILRARSTDSETDLFRLTAEIMCNILVSDRSDTAYKDASESLTTIVRSIREDPPADSVKHAVKLESCCRVIATLMNGTDLSRALVAEANGVPAVLEAIEQIPGNKTLLQTGLWAFWSMSASDRERDDHFLVRAAETLGDSAANSDRLDSLLLPLCGFYGNMCLIPGMKASSIPISAVVHTLITVDDVMVLKEAERAVSNFCTCFPDHVDDVVDAFDLDQMQDQLQSSSDLSPTLCTVIASVASKSDRARGRMASAGIVDSTIAKLRHPGDATMTKSYLEMLASLVVGGTHRATRMPDDAVQVVLRIIQSNPNSEIQWVCCALLRNLLVAAASPPDVSGLVDSMVSLVDSHNTHENLKVQACSVIWALTGKYPKQDTNDLAEMSRSMITILIKYKGDQGSFDYELLAMAAGALASITACMIHNPILVSSEDVDEIISVPYTALDFEADRTELYVRILDSIYNLSYVSHEVLIQCGVIVVVIDTMAEFEQCLEVQQFGCAILGVLASTENLQVNLSIVQTDGIDMIVNALALFSDDSVVQSQACKALSHLSIDEESRMLIASLGGLMLLGNTMRANMDNLDLLEGALSAVLSLSADADVELLSESNIVAVVVAVMRHHRTVSQIQEFGMGVLQNISMRCFESKQTIADAGGIVAVADCIREFMGSPTVLERAFTTLWSLAVLDQNQALIAEADGINLVVNGMMTAITYEGVQKQGCGCLCTLSSDSRNKGLIQNVGGVDSIVYAMWAHYGAEEIQVEACRALSSLAVDAQTNEVMIASDGEVNAIISAMRRFPVSERLQEHACVALRNFLLSADNVDIIKSNEHEVRMLVQQAASRFPEACQERANQVLASLG